MVEGDTIEQYSKDNFSFFHENKLQIKPKPTNKTKITKQKNKNGNNVSRTKTFKREKIVYFAFFSTQNLFLEKFEIFLIT